MHRLLALMVVSVATISGTLSGTPAQDVSGAPAEETGGSTANLAFSRDGRTLREVWYMHPGAPGLEHIRENTYDVATRKKSHELNLGPDTSLCSATSDGRTAIILVTVYKDHERAGHYLLRVDMETGRSQRLPSQWFNADSTEEPCDAGISGDGRLVSAYSIEGPEYSTDVVAVYDWATRKLVAKQTTGGANFGGMTSDGKIVFYYLHGGSRIVDPRTGQTLMGYGPPSDRSADGRWVVDFPNPIVEPPAEVPILNGMNGQTVGKLDLQMTDEEASWSWNGAFCGASGKFVAAGPDEVLVFSIPSGKKLTSFPLNTWKDPNNREKSRAFVACSPGGKHVAIRDGDRLTLHDLN